MSCFYTQPSNVCHLIGVFEAFTFNVIFYIIELKSITFLFPFSPALDYHCLFLDGELTVGWRSSHFSLSILSLRQAICVQGLGWGLSQYSCPSPFRNYSWESWAGENFLPFLWEHTAFFITQCKPHGTGKGISCLISVAYGFASTTPSAVLYLCLGLRAGGFILLFRRHMDFASNSPTEAIDLWALGAEWFPAPLPGVSAFALHVRKSKSGHILIPVCYQGACSQIFQPVSSLLCEHQIEPMEKNWQMNEDSRAPKDPNLPHEHTLSL